MVKSGSILVVDVGNTSVCLGIERGRRILKVSRLQANPCTARVVRDTIKDIVRGRDIEGAALSSVVPGLTDVWIDQVATCCGVTPLVVHHRLNMGIRIDYPRPATIGADRLANACGAVSRYGAPVIVVDFGTALTFDIVSHDKTYVGGIIAPGLPVMTDYLAEKTALLPRVRLEGRSQVVGKSTMMAMRIGAKVGYRGMVREIVEHVKAGLGMKRVKLCATGGYAKWVLDDLHIPLSFDPHLTLYGLGRIYEWNTGRET